ncbi:MAG: hypothetical protein WC238_02735 [Parcubacteria group bacterium]|jgi:hypothetical protein
MRAKFRHLKLQAIALRKSGKTYNEIRGILGHPVPKSTLSLWCQGMVFSDEHRKKMEEAIKYNLHKGRALALASNKIKRDKYLQDVYNRVSHLGKIFKNKEVSKISLAMLYLGEGSKTGGSMMFGNSNPVIISLFLRLLRYCYKIDESKFRCTIQCRADQNIKKLEKFWMNITRISPELFYKAKIDKRTIGKTSKKLEYKGVCRIDYFSADIFNELTKIVEVINK